MRDGVISNGFLSVYNNWFMCYVKDFIGTHLGFEFRSVDDLSMQENFTEHMTFMAEY